jgi:hypothetical protein
VSKDLRGEVDIMLLMDESAIAEKGLKIVGVARKYSGSLADPKQPEQSPRRHLKQGMGATTPVALLDQAELRACSKSPEGYLS